MIIKKSLKDWQDIRLRKGRVSVMSEFVFYRGRKKLTPEDQRNISQNIKHFDWVEDCHHQDEDWGLIYTKNKSDEIEVFDDPAHENTFLLHGYICESESFGNGHRFIDEQQKKRECIIERYHQQGINGLIGLNGLYNLFVWKRKTKVLEVANDRLGVFQVFFFPLNDNEFVLTTNLANLKVICPDRLKLNRRGLFDLLYVGNQFEDRTILESAYRILPNASFKVENGKIKLLLQKKLIFSRERWADVTPKILDELEAYYQQAIKRQLRPSHRHIYLQSGGKDSRLFSHFLKQCGIMPDTVTVGEKHHGETHISRLVSRQLGFPWRRIPINENIEFDAAQKFFSIDSYSGETYSSWYFTPLSNAAGASYDYCLTAFIGDAVMGSAIIKGNLEGHPDDKTAFKNYLNHFRRGFLTIDQLKLLMGEEAVDFAESYEKEAFELFMSQGEYPYQRIVAYDLRIEDRMKLGGCIRSVNAGIPVRLPCLDTDLMDFIFSLPPALLYDRQFIDIFLSKRAAHLGAIPLDGNDNLYMALVASVKHLVPFRLWREWNRKIYFPFIRLFAPLKATSRFYVQAFSMENHGFRKLNNEAILSCDSLEGFLYPDRVKEMLVSYRPTSRNHITSGNLRRSLITTIFAVKEFSRI